VLHRVSVGAGHDGRRGSIRRIRVRYPTTWTATLPLPVRQGEPAGAAQEDIGQSLASTQRKLPPLTLGSFHVGVSHV